MEDVVDVSFSCGGHASFLAGAGIKTIIRYYSRDTGLPTKRLTRPEAEQFAAAGLKIGIVHEAKHGDKPIAFSHDLGVMDATYSRDYGRQVIRQPSGSAIYFGVDFDVTSQQLQGRIIPYFTGVASVLRLPNGSPSYKIGVYGSGRVCSELQTQGLVDYTWLAQSTGWADYNAYKQAKRWAIRQLMPVHVGEIEGDPDIVNPDTDDIGDFMLEAVHVPSPGGTPALGDMKVIAGSGLRLRAGPGTDFDVIGLVPLDTRVKVMKVVGDWVMADVDHDGAADGFLNSHFLAS
jgi:hypothetical protein